MHLSLPAPPCTLLAYERWCICVFANVRATVAAPGSSRAWTSEWVVVYCQWWIRRLDIMKQKIKMPRCQNFQGQRCCTLSFQVGLAQDFISAALSAFLNRRYVPELVKPISGRAYKLPEDPEMSGLACLQASRLNFRKEVVFKLFYGRGTRFSKELSLPSPVHRREKVVWET